MAGWWPRERDRGASYSGAFRRRRGPRATSGPLGGRSASLDHSLAALGGGPRVVVGVDVSEAHSGSGAAMLHGPKPRIQGLGIVSNGQATM